MNTKFIGFVPIYHWPDQSGIGFVSAMGAHVFSSEDAARRKPKGPMVPRNIEVIGVARAELELKL